MCFSNLPVEFDEAGNPYLADEAEDVDRPGASGRDAEGGSATGDVGVDVAVDPEGVYEAIVASLPADTRERVERGDGGKRVGDERDSDGDGEFSTSRPGPNTGPESAEGD